MTMKKPVLLTRRLRTKIVTHTNRQSGPNQTEYSRLICTKKEVICHLCGKIIECDKDEYISKCRGGNSGTSKYFHADCAIRVNIIIIPRPTLIH